MSLEKFVAEPRIPENVQEIVNRRFSWLTVDIDEDAEFRLAKALDKVRELQLPFSLYRTARGYHVRAMLPRVYDFQTLMSLRDGCLDDFSRREIDESYHRAGLDFLTNFLFNEKAWIEGNEIKTYSEKEVSLGEVTVARKGEISIELPKLSISGRISIEVDKGVVTARGPADILTKEYFDLIRQSIEDNFWEYSFKREQEEDIKTKIVNAYAKISPKAMFVASKCDVEVNYSIVTLKVPPELSDYIGILIGKEGKNIKTVQEETGLKVVIARPAETAKPKTEEEKMREKLQEMLKSLV
jgi:predicted RNA-binding protein Jag